MPLYKIIVVFALAAYWPDSFFAQEDLNEQERHAEDSVKIQHPFKKAVLYSAIVPGAGQIYNHIHLPRTSRRKWNVYWKVPLIYGAMGGSVYMLITNQLEIGKIKNEYNSRTTIENYVPQNYTQYDNFALVQLHNATQTQRDLFIMTSVLAHVINILDAAVEAHFINFDVSEDLSLNLYPIASPQATFGLGLRLNFKK